MLNPREGSEVFTTLSDLSPALRSSPLADHRLLAGTEAGAESAEAFAGVIDHVVRELLLRSKDRLIELLPSLGLLYGREVPLSELRARSSNVLVQAGLTHWTTLSERTVADLRDLRNTGTTTVEDILSLAVSQAASALATKPSMERPVAWVVDGNLHEEADVTRAGDGLLSEDNWDTLAGQVLRAVRLAATWAVSEGRGARLADIFTIATPGLPVDVATTLSSAGNISVSELLSPGLDQSSLDELAEDVLACLSGDQRQIAERRLLKQKPDTLEQVGNTLGLTRERVRQIQLKTRDRLGDLLAEESCRPLQWRAGTLAAALGAAVPASSPLVSEALRQTAGEFDHHSTLKAVLLYLAGPYRTQEGHWWVRAESAIPSVHDLLAAMASDRSMGIVDAEAWLSSRGFVPEILPDWVQLEPKLKFHEGLLLNWSGSAIDKCVTLLQLWRRPASAEALVEGAGEGHNVRSIRQRLFDDPRFMRVNRSDWVLREWGGEEYTGISEEIEQRILEWGGRAKLADLVDVLVEQFAVAAGSVRVYAEAPKFVIEDGWVRLRTAADALEARQTLPTTRGLYRRSPSSWAYVLHVDSEVLRGSGRHCPEVLARALLLNPGEECTFASAAGPLRLTWPITSAFGPALGSTRALAVQVGAQSGDDLRIQFDLTRQTCEAVRIAPALLGNRDSCSALRLLTGLELRDGELVEGVADGVGTSVAELVGVLRRRGDDQLADLLPPPADVGLADALADLAALFEND